MRAVRRTEEFVQSFWSRTPSQRLLKIIELVARTCDNAANELALRWVTGRANIDEIAEAAVAARAGHAPSSRFFLKAQSSLQFCNRIRECSWYLFHNIEQTGTGGVHPFDESAMWRISSTAACLWTMNVRI